MTDQAKGGFFFVPDVLVDVFLPQIGCDGVVVYLTLCRLVPRAEKAQAGISISSIAVLSCVSKATVERAVSRMVDLGMVRKFPSLKMGPARFELVDLQEAAPRTYARSSSSSPALATPARIRRGKEVAENRQS
jgi:hypothetical protein